MQMAADATFRYGGIPIPEKLQTAFDFGVYYFEVIHPLRPKTPDQRISFTQRVYGLWPIRVTEIYSNGAESYTAKTITDNGAHIEFDPAGRNGRLVVGFVPDDKFWHNRVWLAQNMQYEVRAMHGKDFGTRPKQYVDVEMNALRDTLNEEITIYRFIDSFGKEVENFANEDHVKAFREKEIWNEANKRYERPYANMQIVTGKKIIQRSRVGEIANNNRHHPDGWTASDDFIREIKEPTLALIEERRPKQETSSIHSVPSEDMLRDRMKALLGSMTIEEKKELLNLSESPAPKATDEDGRKADPSAITAETVDTNTIYTATDLGRMKKDVLISLGTKQGLDVNDGMHRKDILNTVLEYQKFLKEVEDNKPAGEQAPGDVGEDDVGEEIT